METSFSGGIEEVIKLVPIINKTCLDNMIADLMLEYVSSSPSDLHNQLVDLNLQILITKKMIELEQFRLQLIEKYESCDPTWLSDYTLFLITTWAYYSKDVMRGGSSANDPNDADSDNSGASKQKRPDDVVEEFDNESASKASASVADKIWGEKRPNGLLSFLTGSKGGGGVKCSDRSLEVATKAGLALDRQRNEHLRSNLETSQVMIRNNDAVHKDVADDLMKLINITQEKIKTVKDEISKKEDQIQRANVEAVDKQRTEFGKKSAALQKEIADRKETLWSAQRNAGLFGAAFGLLGMDSLIFIPEFALNVVAEVAFGVKREAQYLTSGWTWFGADERSQCAKDAKWGTIADWNVIDNKMCAASKDSPEESWVPAVDGKCNPYSADEKKKNKNLVDKVYEKNKCTSYPQAVNLDVSTKTRGLILMIPTISAALATRASMRKNLKMAPLQYPGGVVVSTATSAVSVAAKVSIWGLPAAYVGEWMYFSFTDSDEWKREQIAVSAGEIWLKDEWINQEDYVSKTTHLSQALRNLEKQLASLEAERDTLNETLATQLNGYTEATVLRKNTATILTDRAMARASGNEAIPSFAIDANGSGKQLPAIDEEEKTPPKSWGWPRLTGGRRNTKTKKMRLTNKRKKAKRITRRRTGETRKRRLHK
jgi:hypothetical protein